MFKLTSPHPIAVPGFPNFGPAPAVLSGQNKSHIFVPICCMPSVFFRHSLGGAPSCWLGLQYSRIYYYMSAAQSQRNDCHHQEEREATVRSLDQLEHWKKGKFVNLKDQEGGCLGVTRRCCLVAEGWIPLLIENRHIILGTFKTQCQLRLLEQF